MEMEGVRVDWKVSIGHTNLWHSTFLEDLDLHGKIGGKICSNTSFNTNFFNFCIDFAINFVNIDLNLLVSLIKNNLDIIYWERIDPKVNILNVVSWVIKSVIGNKFIYIRKEFLFHLIEKSIIKTNLNSWICIFNWLIKWI